MEAVIHYMYNGGINLNQNHLTSFLRTAKMLKIKGLDTYNKHYSDDEDNLSPSGKKNGTQHNSNGCLNSKSIRTPNKYIKPTVKPISKTILTDLQGLCLNVYSN